MEKEKKGRQIRMDLVATVGMLTKEEAAQALLVSPQQIDKMRHIGMLKGTKTGQAWRFGQDELKKFQEEYKGFDVSNEQAMLNALKVRKRLNA